MVLEKVCVRSKWQGFGYADVGSLIHIKSVLSQEVRLGEGWRGNSGRIYTKGLGEVDTRTRFMGFMVRI